MELSAAQDIEAGDGTTSVVVLAGSLLAAAEKILSLGELFSHLFSIVSIAEHCLHRYPPNDHCAVLPEGCSQSRGILDGTVLPSGSQ